MEKLLLELLSSDTRPFKKGYLMKRLRLKGKDGESLLKKELDKLLEKNIIRVKNELVFFIFKDKKQGTLSMNKRGFGFISTNDEFEDDYFCHGSKNGGAMSGDVVEFVTKKRKDSRTGVEKTDAMVLRVIERNSKMLVGLIERKVNEVKFIPDDKSFVGDVKILNKKKGMDEEKAIFNITKYMQWGVEGEIGEILGHKNDPGIDILSMIHQHHIEIEFSKKTLEEVAMIDVDIDPSDIKNRVDLRKDTIFTIDGIESKDLDDAISIKKDGANYILGVHIADVSHYVKEGTSLDDDAFSRATSVYLMDRVVPMLPRKLSNGVCSVNPGVDRYTLSCEITISSDGKVMNKKVYESVINSKYRMTYKDVNLMISMDKIIRNNYSKLTPIIDDAIKLSHIIRNKKSERGTIDFEVDEPKFLLDEKGKIKEIIRRTRGEAEMMIEDFMIMANEAVSSLMLTKEYPFVYRNHDKPKTDKFTQFLSVAKIFGHSFKGDVGNLDSKSVQVFINSFADKKEASALRVMMLRAMAKAVYEPINIGHFGLASTGYSHFTSPIRRYPDLMVHRLLKQYILKKNLNRDQEGKLRKKLPYMAEHCSNKEVAAVNCERDVVKLKMCEFMENHVGETYKGKISGLAGFGFFVQLDNLVDGMVHMSRLTDDEYNYDEKTMTLLGARSKKRYMIGDEVEIEVIGASKNEMTIDFKIKGMDDPKHIEEKMNKSKIINKK